MNLFEQYINAGFSVVPLTKSGGKPKVKWSKYTKELPGSEAEKWKGDIAVVCGEVSDLIALDIDTDEEIEGLEDLIKDSKIRKVGSKGFTVFFGYRDLKSKSWKKNGKVVAELLSDKRLTTIPPSNHRSKKGVTYQWESEDLLTGEFFDLDDKVIELLDRLFPEPPRKETKDWGGFDFEDHDISLSEARDALSYVNPDCDRDTWIKAGMALRAEFGDAAYDMWDNWSAGGSKYKPKEMSNVWRSFNNGGIGIGTLVWLAKEGGWIPKVEMDESIVSYISSISDASSNSSSKVAKVTKITEDAEDAEDNNDLEGYFNSLEKTTLCRPPANTLVGKIYDWIMATSIMPQHDLAVAASLCAVGVLKGQRYRTQTDLRTNLLCFGLAPSGSGKDHARKCIHNLFHKAELDVLISGEPASHAGLLNCLYRDGGVKLVCMDEIGKTFQSMMHKNAQTHHTAILAEITKLFTSASSVYKGREYADSGDKNPPKTIDQPCLCIYGTGVPEDVKEGLITRNVVDGLLARWLMFESDDVPEDVEVYDFGVPDSLAEEVRAVRVESTYTTEAVIVPFSKDAAEYNRELRSEYKKRIRARDEFGSIYSRAVEHINKIALVLCDNKTIELEDMIYAQKVVEYSIHNMIKLCDDIVENDVDALKKRIVRIIRKNGGSATKSLIVRGCQSFTARDLSDALVTMVEGELIEVNKVKSSKAAKKPTQLFSVVK